MKIVLVAIAKNEGRYLAEWLVHHHRMGFDEIVVYDNESSDETPEILRDFAGRMPLRSKTWPTQATGSPQLSAYNDILEAERRDGTWIAFFDLDEFVVPTGALDFRAVVERCAAAGGEAIGINQRVFGANGQDRMEARPVLDRFRRCTLEGSGECYWTKSIYHAPSVPKITNVHVSKIASGLYLHPNAEPIRFQEPPKYPMTESLDYSALQLNHYITKSLEEFMAKRARGGAASADPAARQGRYEDMSFFHNRQFVSNKVEWTDAETHVAANLARARQLAVPAELAGGLASGLQV